MIATLKKVQQDSSPSLYIVAERHSYCPNKHFSVNLEGAPAIKVKKALKRQFAVATETPVSKLAGTGKQRTDLSNSEMPSQQQPTSDPVLNISGSTE